MINLKRLAIKEILENAIIEKPILLPFNEEEMKELIFDIEKDDQGNIFYVFNSILYTVKTKIDYSNVNFEGVSFENIDLKMTYGIKFNPQKIYKKSLKGTKLSKDSKVIGNEKINQVDLFEGVCIEYTEFNGCQNVIIIPQTVYNKDFSYTKLEGVKINGSFDGVSIWNTSFKDSSGAKLDPKTTKNFEYAVSYENTTLLDLPSSRGGHSSINYNELISQKKEYAQQIKELIADQLPLHKPEPPAVVDTKQKRKRFFLINTLD